MSYWAGVSCSRHSCSDLLTLMSLIVFLSRARI